LLRAAFVAPIATPVIEDGAVVIEGPVIREVGRFASLSRHHAVPAADLGRVVLLPGLVNAHCHLALSHLTRGDPPASFVDWLLTIAPRLRLTEPDVDARLTAAARDGAAASLRFGVTCVGDVTIRSDSLRPALNGGPLRVVSYGEALGLARSRPRFEAALGPAIDARHDTGRLTAGLSPHAPYTVDLDGYRQCVALARERGLRLCTHLAEHPDEADFLRSHGGTLRTAYERLGTWADDPPVPTFDGSPVAMAEAVGLLDLPGVVLAHVNYANHHDLARLACGRASVVFCPRTHAYFGHPPHRWREMSIRGINVAVGTDSTASSPDLNLVDDLRLIYRQVPRVDPAVLWEMATLCGARALALEHERGSIEVGKRADLVAFGVAARDPLREVLETQVAPTCVWVEGTVRSPLPPGEG